jgi:hypothetical protein
MVVNRVLAPAKELFGVANCIDAPMLIASPAKWPTKL